MVNKFFVLLIALHISPVCAIPDSIKQKFALIKDHGKELARATLGTCAIGSAAACTYFISEPIFNAYKNNEYVNLALNLSIVGTSLYTMGKLTPYCAKLFMLKKAKLNEDQDVYKDPKKALPYILGTSAFLGASYVAFAKTCQESNMPSSLFEVCIFSTLCTSIGFASYDLLPKIYKTIRAQIKPEAQISESKA